MMMKIKTLFAAVLLSTGIAQAQSDPTIMTINGQPISRSEFEYSYNKNNSEGVIDKKSVDEYVELFINYKLKVAAALEARIDTTKGFRDEFRMYRDQQVRPSFITDADIEKKAFEIYKQTQVGVDENGGLVKPAHILIMMKQKATEEEMAVAKQRADSVYKALKGGADFAELAKKVSDDKGSGAKGGELGWLQKGMTVKEFEDMAYSMKKGEMSEPFKSPFGYHIIKLLDKSMFFPYDSVRKDIVQFIEARGIREQIIDGKIKDLAEAEKVQPEEIVDKRVDELKANDPALENLIREYHDGLLLYEISSRNVWDKAAVDNEGLQRYFKKNKKRYKWDSPRFKGIAYHVKDAQDIKAVKDCVKKIPFEEWADKLRSTFNNDSIVRIRVEKGIFKAGENKLVDRDVFKKDVKVTSMKDYPIDATFGKIIKAPQVYQDVRGQVVADYQDELEKAWVVELRKKYPVVVYKEVLKTVNNH